MAMADIEKEVKEVFGEFDQKACVSLYKATINLTNGKKKPSKRLFLILDTLKSIGLE